MELGSYELPNIQGLGGRGSETFEKVPIHENIFVRTPFGDFNGFHPLGANLSPPSQRYRVAPLQSIVLANATAGLRLGSDEGGVRGVMLPRLGVDKGLVSSDSPAPIPTSPQGRTPFS
jgi:hypothetical protein